MKKVLGTFNNVSEARAAITGLLDQGYSRDEIKVVSETGLGENLVPETEDKSMWERIKDAFTFDEYDENYWDRDLDVNDKKILEKYDANLKNGEIIILVDEEKYGEVDPYKDVDTEGQEQVIDLKKEKLNVDKDVVESGEVNVKKVVKEETQTVEVPLKKEELIIEKRDSNKGVVGEGIDDKLVEGEEIKIPLREERLDVEKKTVVDDEVVLKKVTKQENEVVKEKVKHEEIEVDGDDVDINKEK